MLPLPEMIEGSHQVLELIVVLGLRTMIGKHGLEDQILVQSSLQGEIEFTWEEVDHVQVSLFESRP